MCKSAASANTIIVDHAAGESGSLASAAGARSSGLRGTGVAQAFLEGCGAAGALPAYWDACGMPRLWGRPLHAVKS